MTLGRTQNDEAIIDQMRSTVMDGLTALQTNVQAAQTTQNVLTPFILGMALVNNFGSSLAYPAPAPARAPRLGSPRHVAPVLIKPVGSFGAGGAAPAFALAPGLVLTPGPVVMLAAAALAAMLLQAAKLNNAVGSFQGMVSKAFILFCKEYYAQQACL
ncbi:hypothetical protein B7463_g5652, partial [Scytalidium lignicola]